jgi:hypothetical protein
MNLAGESNYVNLNSSQETESRSPSPNPMPPPRKVETPFAFPANTDIPTFDSITTPHLGKLFGNIAPSISVRRSTRIAKRSVASSSKKGKSPVIKAPQLSPIPVSQPAATKTPSSAASDVDVTKETLTTPVQYRRQLKRGQKIKTPLTVQRKLKGYKTPKDHKETQSQRKKRMANRRVAKSKLMHSSPARLAEEHREEMQALRESQRANGLHEAIKQANTEARRLSRKRKATEEPVRN